MKKDQYFNMEVNFLNDDHVLCMMDEENGAESLGVYLILLLHLRTKDDYEASCELAAVRSLARRYGVAVEAMVHVLHDFDLFEVDEERQMFRSHYLDRVIMKLEERWRQNRINGQKGGRPAKHAKTSGTPASKGQKPNETQEKKEEEKRGITPVNINSSNTALPAVASAAAVGDDQAELAVVPTAAVVTVDVASPASMTVRSVDEEGQRPLQPVLSWEKLVRQLSTSREYMELAGMHSGLGRLFLDHQERIIELFTDHIRLYDKGGQLLFFEDVKRYFSNYIAANSTTCRIVRDTLLSEYRQKNEEDMYCFETRVDGQRTYFGYSIPNDAPPRPDAAAVWDGVKSRWVH